MFCSFLLRMAIVIAMNNGNNDKDKQIWFTEWSENKIGKIDVSDRHLPFSVGVSYSESDSKELTIKRGESEKINVKVKTTGSQLFILS